MEETKPTILYRYERGLTSHFGTIVTGNISLNEYDIIGETPQGYWIDQVSGRSFRTWVSKTARKRYAYPTPEEAMVNFIKRTEHCIDIQRAMLEKSKAFLEAAKHKQIQSLTLNPSEK